MAYIYINDTMYANIIRNTELTPALWIREVILKEIERKGWDKK